MKRRKISKPGKALALLASALDWSHEQSETPGVTSLPSVAILDIRGPLEQRGSWFLGYDEIRCAFDAALQSDAPVVVLRIDSPGGECAGCFEAVRAMRASAKRAGKRVIAYVDEGAYSAAYALATVADEIVLPPSGGVGSIGVISQLVSFDEMNKRQGIRFEVVTSGARKSDGHPEVPITDEAKIEEQKVVWALADLFFDLVNEARPLSVDEIEGLEAGCFYGQSAIDAGLADVVMGFDSLIDELSKPGAGTMAKKAKKQIEDTSGDDVETTTTTTTTTAEPDPSEDDMGDDDDDDDDDEAAVAASAPVRRPKAGAPVACSSRDLLAAVRLVTGGGTAAEQRRALLGMHRELSTLREEMFASRVSAIGAKVDAAIASGRIAPSQKAFAIKMGKADPGMLDEYLGGATPIVRRSPTQAADPIDAKKLGSVSLAFSAADERAYLASGCEAHGITREQYSAQKADVVKQQSALQ